MHTHSHSDIHTYIQTHIEKHALTYICTIYEYNKDGVLLDKNFTAEEAEGGSGVITFVVNLEQRESFDLSRVYLRATLTWDETITPSLSGLQNIDPDERPDGIVVGVKSGVNKVRKYRIMGFYE